jgi:hypothetical protein
MLGMLIISLAQHAVATAGGVARQLGVFVVELLRRAAYPHFRTGTVEHMVAVKRDAILLVAESASTTAALTVAAATHALHIHRVVSILVC